MGDSVSLLDHVRPVAKGDCYSGEAPEGTESAWGTPFARGAYSVLRLGPRLWSVLSDCLGSPSLLAMDALIFLEVSM